MSTVSPGSWQYGLNLSTLRGFKLPLVEEIQVASAAGYTSVEPWIAQIDQYVAEGGSLADLKQRLVDLNLTVEGAIGFFEWIVDDADRRAAALDEAGRNMELLAAIGGKRIAAPAMGATDIADHDLLKIADRYRAILDIGDRYGVYPEVEVWGHSNTLNRLGDAAAVAIESGHRHACVLADVFHLYKGGSGHDGLRLLSAEMLPVLHVNDYPDMAPDVITDADRVYPGDGVAPLTQIFRDLKSIGFHGALSLELFNESYWRQDPMTVARTGLAKTRAAAEKSDL